MYTDQYVQLTHHIITTKEAKPIVYEPLDDECDIFIQYYHKRPPTASLFTNGLFEFYFNSLNFSHSFSSTKCVQPSTTLDPRRIIEISKYPFHHPNRSRHSIYIDIGREGCGALYHEPTPSNYTIIAYNYYNSKTYKQRQSLHQVYLPLFMRYDFGSYSDDIYPLIRDYKTHTKLFDLRQRLLSVAMSIASGQRAEYGFVFEDIAEAYGKRIFIRMIKKWRNKNEGYRLHKRDEVQYLNGEKYRKLLIDTQFNACVDGNNPEAFRIAETLAMAAIPIVVIKTNEYMNHTCGNALDPFIRHGEGGGGGEINIDRQFSNQHLVFSRESFEKDWFYFNEENGFDVVKLNELYEKHLFSPLIVLGDWNDLKPFLNLFNMNRQNEKAILFWNTFQKYLNTWFKSWMQFKQHELADVIIRNLYST